MEKFKITITNKIDCTGVWGFPQQAKIDENSPMQKQGLCQFFRKCICTYCACSYTLSRYLIYINSLILLYVI